MSLKKSLEYILTNWVAETQKQFADNALASFFRGEFHDLVRRKVDEFDRSWMTKASVGAGNWANIPWLSILNPKITTGTTDGVYPVYLFCGDGSGVYLSLAQGVSEPIRKYGRHKAQERAQEIKANVLAKVPQLKSWSSDPLNLKASTQLGKSYESTNIASKFYSVDSIPDDAQLAKDLNELLNAYKKIESIAWWPAEHKGLERDPIVSCLLPKPFLLLAGISGTGKTRFVRKQAEHHQLGRSNYCLVAVRPDWHEPSDLLGYVTRLSGTAAYITTDVLRFMVSAWKALHTAGLRISGDGGNGGNESITTYLSGSNAQLDAVAPYWLCLDEMNLAPVEQYFSDYLSLIETREWQHTADGELIYSCDALLKASVLRDLDSVAQRQLAISLGLGDISAGNGNDELWDHFIQYGIAIPPNLIVAGTVNMDETTHGFSRKVIDRAMSFDFGEFFPNKFDDYYPAAVSHVPLTFPRHSTGRQSLLEADAQPSIDFLDGLNTLLKGTPFELAYRALNELLLAVHCHGTPPPGPELEAVWDDFLMQKVLPRIEGDADKLQGVDQGTDSRNLLENLRDRLEGSFANIWAEDSRRIDFYRKRGDVHEQVVCRSKRKIDWMLERLESSGFTSFWP